MDEDIPRLEDKKLVPKADDNDGEDVIGEIVAELVDVICMLEDGAATTAVLASSEIPGTTGQGVVLTGAVQMDEENIPAKGKEEMRVNTTLDRPNDRKRPQ